MSYLQDWYESAQDAMAALRAFREFIIYAKSHEGWVPDQVFQDMMRMMRAQGLDKWLDTHPLDLDKLYKAITGTIDVSVAYQEGYNEGYDVGFDHGHEKGYEKAEEDAENC